MHAHVKAKHIIANSAEKGVFCPVKDSKILSSKRKKFFFFVESLKTRFFFENGNLQYVSKRGCNSTVNLSAFALKLCFPKLFFITFFEFPKLHFKFFRFLKDHLPFQKCETKKLYETKC
jgi:hypothetical protein